MKRVRRQSNPVALAGGCRRWNPAALWRSRGRVSLESSSSILKNKIKEKPSVFLRTEGFLYFYFVVSERTFLAAFGSIVRRIPVSGSTSRVTGAVCLRPLKTFKGSLRGFTPHPTNFLKKVGSKTFKPVASSFLPRRPASSWRLPASAAADLLRRRELWTQSSHCSASWR